MLSLSKAGRQVLNTLTLLTIYLLLMIVVSLVILAYLPSYSDNTMPDAPDDFDYSNVGEFTANLDSSELAARLYSPSIFARHGNVIMMTDFSRGLSGLQTQLTEPGAEISLTTLFAQQSGMSLKLYTTFTDELSCGVYIHLPYVAARYYSIDVGYRLTGSGDYISVELDVAKDNNARFIKMWHSPSDGIAYAETFNTYQYDVSSLFSSYALSGTEQHMRLIMDSTLVRYKELWLNGEMITLPDQELDGGSGWTGNEIRGIISLAANSGGNATAYLQWIVIAVFDES